MIRRNAPRLVALAAALLLAPAACAGDDSPTDSASTTLTTASSPTTPSSVVATTATSASATTSPTTAPDDAVRLIEVTFAGGQVAGGVQRRPVRIGEKVRLRVESDVADEVHVHTYDLRAAVNPGQPAVIELVASIPGRHEVELEKKHKQLLVLEVR
jgi:hypothetical protein